MDNDRNADTRNQSPIAHHVAMTSNQHIHRQHVLIEKIVTMRQQPWPTNWEELPRIATSSNDGVGR